MLSDQANDLRRLVFHSVRTVGSPDAPPPKLIVVSGAKGGVGTTTVAVNLAAALAREGCRVVLVDADFAGPDVAELCGLDAIYGAADVLAGRRTVHEVLERGPIGIHVLPARRGTTEPDDCTPQAQERLIGQLQSLGAHADYVVLDAGSGGGRIMRRFWESAAAALVVTHPDAVSVTDAYALIKLMCNDNPPPTTVGTVVNCVDDEIEDDVHRRLDRACRRFLGFSPMSVGRVPYDPCVPRAVVEQRPLLVQSISSKASAALAALADEVPALTANEVPGRLRFATPAATRAG